MAVKLGSPQRPLRLYIHHPAMRAKIQSIAHETAAEWALSVLDDDGLELSVLQYVTFDEACRAAAAMAEALPNATITERLL